MGTNRVSVVGGRVVLVGASGRRFVHDRAAPVDEGIDLAEVALELRQGGGEGLAGIVRRGPQVEELPQQRGGPELLVEEVDLPEWVLA